MTDWDDRMEALRQRFIDWILSERQIFEDDSEPDWELVEWAAHRVQGSAAMFGFTDLGRAADGLEQAIRAGRGDAELRRRMALLWAEIERLQPR